MRAHLLGWDPIGLADAPEAQDEYDAYLSSPAPHVASRRLDRCHHGLADEPRRRAHWNPVADGSRPQSRPATHRLVGVNHRPVTPASALGSVTFAWLRVMDKRVPLLV